MQRREDIRAGDSDRQLVGDRLRAALDEGRINLMEYDDRLQQAYSAKTYGELDKLLDDLPKVTPAQASQLATTDPTTHAVPAPVAPGTVGARDSSKALASMWGGWLTASLITSAVWVVSAVNMDENPYFWPIWVIVPFGAVCLAKTIRRWAGDDSVGNSARDEYRQRRRERRDRRRGRP